MVKPMALTRSVPNRSPRAEHDPASLERVYVEPRAGTKQDNRQVSLSRRLPAGHTELLDRWAEVYD
jgi:hypothetical protein